jgi:hypothetical protein
MSDDAPRQEEKPHAALPVKLLCTHLGSRATSPRRRRKDHDDSCRVAHASSGAMRSTSTASPFFSDGLTLGSKPAREVERSAIKAPPVVNWRIRATPKRPIGLGKAQAMADKFALRA